MDVGRFREWLRDRAKAELRTERRNRSRIGKTFSKNKEI